MVSEPESMTAVIGWSQRICSVRAARVYDGNVRVEPVDIVPEPESMTAVIELSQRIWCQSQSL